MFLLSTVCAFVFIVPRMVFSFPPLKVFCALWCHILSALHISSEKEERERLCYPSPFCFITVVLEFGPQKAGAGLCFHLNHMGSVSSLV